MAFLISLIVNAAHYLGLSMSDLWVALQKFLTTKWAVFVLVVGVAFLIIANAGELATLLVTILADLVIDNFNLVPSAALLNVLAIANTFFPLAELCVLTLAYGALLLGMTVYRFIKSMIPSPLPGGGGT